MAAAQGKHCGENRDQGSGISGQEGCAMSVRVIADVWDSDLDDSIKGEGAK